MDKLLFCLIFVLSFSCHSHLKWIAVSSDDQVSPLKIHISEGVVPFVEDRKFVIDEISVSNSTGNAELKRADFEITNSKNAYIVSFPEFNTKNSRIVVESGPVFKSGFANRKKSKPDRIEFSRLLTYSCASCRTQPRQYKNYHLDIVPMSPFPLKVGKMFQFKVYNSGQPMQGSFPVLYKIGSSTPIKIDMSSGVGSFVADQVGRYYIAVEHIQKINGFFKYPHAKELHLFAALTLEVQ